MTTSFARKDPGLAYGLSFSTALHLSLFALLTLTHFTLRTTPPEQVYYVDVVNLPVLRPQAGSPAAPSKTAPIPTAPPAPSAPATQAMKIPVPAAKTPAIKAPAAKPQAQAPATKSPSASQAESGEFEDRMAKLQQEADERRQSAAFDALRKKVAAAAATPAGVPKGTGDETGSDYASYIQSRLYDAFKVPKSLPGKNQEVMILLAINRYGRMADYRIERSTGDKAFEEAVARAVAKAERNFRPPPNNATFEHRFVFKPDSVGKK